MHFFYLVCLCALFFHRVRRYNLIVAISNTKLQSKMGFKTCRSVFYESYSTLNDCSERKGCKRAPSLILSKWVHSIVFKKAKMTNFKLKVFIVNPSHISFPVRPFKKTS